MKKIAVLTSGGDAPGMNSAIHAIAKIAMKKNIEVYGVYQGYVGLVEARIQKLEQSDISEIINKGGTILESGRLPEFKQIEVIKKAIQQLTSLDIEGLIVIGGDGSYRGASEINDLGMPCIAIPGTIDNDINGTDKTIGFHTALNNIVDAVNKLRDTSRSHHRCFVVEVMGRDSGQLAIHAAIACGSDVVITKDSDYHLDQVLTQLQREGENRSKKHALVIVSENILDVHELAKEIDQNTNFSGRAVVLGHIQRGGTPVAEDRILASRMGKMAVDLLLKGISGECICVNQGHIIHKDIMWALQDENDKDYVLYQLFEDLA